MVSPFAPKVIQHLFSAPLNLLTRQLTRTRMVSGAKSLDQITPATAGVLRDFRREQPRIVALSVENLADRSVLVNNTCQQRVLRGLEQQLANTLFIVLPQVHPSLCGKILCV